MMMLVFLVSEDLLVLLPLVAGLRLILILVYSLVASSFGLVPNGDLSTGITFRIMML